MRERKIETAWLEQALTKPQRTEPDEDEPGFEHRLAVIAECDYRVLRVVCDPRDEPLKIVTLHFDRSAPGIVIESSRAAAAVIWLTPAKP